MIINYNDLYITVGTGNNIPYIHGANGGFFLIFSEVPGVWRDADGCCIRGVL